MLTLTRRVGETLIVEPVVGLNPDLTVRELFAGGPIRIAVHEVHNRNQVRIGIQAPVQLSIVRAELLGIG